MQVKKFEAPTIQEALDIIKRELGPEAIILQTKKSRSGFGLLSKGSVEVTAAVSERAVQKKKLSEAKLPPENRELLLKMPAKKQKEIYDKTMDAHLDRVASVTKDRVAISPKVGVTGYVNDQVPTYARPEPRQAAPAARTAAPMRSSAPVVAGKVITSRQYIDIEDETPSAKSPLDKSVQEEMRQLKRMLEELKSAQEKETTGNLGSGAQALLNPGVLSTPALQDAYEQLVINGVDKRYAYQLVKRASFEVANRTDDPETVIDQVAMELMSSTEVMSLFGHIQPKAKGADHIKPICIALVGPTGVGKTTTVAKLASEALLKRGLRVGLINLDSYKVAAVDQLATYAKILNMPFRSVSSTEELQNAMADFSGLDLVLMDTTGRSQKDPKSLQEMKSLIESVPGIQTQLVLSATTRDAESYDMTTRFSMFHPQGIILSKLDEATTYGSVFNVSHKSKLPLLYFTTGQRVPEDIEEATRERVVSLVMDL